MKEYRPSSREKQPTSRNSFVDNVEFVDYGNSTRSSGHRELSGRAYYNENDPYAAQWLRNLIDEGLIAPGDVDVRSIVDVKPDDLVGYTQCHFFAGIGGWSLALRRAGWSDDRRVWTGSCPCQPFSVAGARKGFEDARHLFPFWSDLIEERRPPSIFGEQVAAASEWLGLVRGRLEGLEYAVGAIPVEAASAGADHLRDRYWFVADSDSAAIRDEPRRRGGSYRSGSAINGDDCEGRLVHAELPSQERQRSHGGEVLPHQATAGPHRPSDVGDSAGFGRREGRSEYEVRSGRAASASHGGAGDHLEWVIGADGKARRVKSGIRLLAHGVPARVGKLRAFGNAIDPRPAAAFITAYMDFCLERELLQ